MKIVVVAGARPNFMKIAPILAELRRHPDEFTPYLVHTGQHYDYQMSDIFFEELDLPAPDSFLEAASATPTAQAADIMLKFESVVERERPDLLIVVGDVTSTAACTLVATHRGIPVAHVEAGLRSGDRRMPEELNRIVTDGLADLLFTYSADADANLKAENVPESCIHRVGNVMIDTLLRFRPKASASPILDRIGARPREYGLVTLHRPSNVDRPEVLGGILEAFAQIQRRLPLYFLIHPRTRKNIERFGMQPLLDRMENFHPLDPLGYIDMLRMQEQARLVLTDSGGIQEETTVLDVPCLTIRENTERPVTITHGTNILVGCSGERIVAEATRILDGQGKKGRVPELWDGHTAERLAGVLRQGVRRR